MTDQPPPSPVKSRIPKLLTAGLAAIVVIAAAVYGIGTLTGNAGGPPECKPAVALASKIAPLVTGQVAAVNIAKRPFKVPNLAFQNRDGQPLKLAAFRGRTVLLNLWATWCVPCRAEMPTLDKLEGDLGSPDFKVVAVNVDTGNTQRAKTFFKQIGVKNLTYYADPSGEAFQNLKEAGRAIGMPTTMLVDPKGCEIGTVAGAADWGSNDALKLIKAALGKS